MADQIDLIQLAAAGSTSAHLGLVDLAISAGACGNCRQIESLAAAETWARLAAAGGGKEENRALVGVLLARVEFEIGRCAVYNAQWYEGEARRVLKLLAALNDPDAAQALEDLGPAPEGDHREPDVVVATNLAAAARGDLRALGSLCDEALQILHSDRSTPIEALTVGELYARLASASGEPDQLRRLAGILLKRSEYEYREGWSAVGDSAVVEAAVIFSILTDAGDLSMAPWLSSLIEDCPISAAATAIRHRPTILAYVEPVGSC